MRYPVVAFLFVFVLGPYAAHALLTGSARILPMAEIQVSQATQRTAHAHLGGGVLISVRQNSPWAAQPSHYRPL